MFHIKTELKRKIGAGSLTRKKVGEAISDRGKTDVRNDFFSSVFVKEDIANKYSLSEWSMMWQLAFDISKCKTLYVGKHNPCSTYFVDTSRSRSIAVCESEKDVVVVFDCFSIFDLHIENCVNSKSIVGSYFMKFCKPGWVIIYYSL